MFEFCRIWFLSDVKYSVFAAVVWNESYYTSYVTSESYIMSYVTSESCNAIRKTCELHIAVELKLLEAL